MHKCKRGKKVGTYCCSKIEIDDKTIKKIILKCIEKSRYSKNSILNNISNNIYINT